MLLIGIILVFLYLVVESRKGNHRAEAFAEMEHAKMILIENPKDSNAYWQFERWRQVYLRVNGITSLSKIIKDAEFEEFE